jgi:hypothetical protein
VFAVAAVRFWSTSTAVVRTSGLISLLALLIFAVLPRKYLALFAARLTVVTLAVTALVANTDGLVHSVHNLELVGIGPVVTQAVIAGLLIIMSIEAVSAKANHVAV